MVKKTSKISSKTLRNQKLPQKHSNFGKKFFPLFLLIVFVALGLFFFIDSGVLRDIETSFSPLFPNFSDSQVRKIEISRSNETVILIKNGEKWMVSENEPYSADTSLIEVALSTLKGIIPDSIASRNQKKHIALGVDEAGALKVSAFDLNGNPIASLLIGKKGPTFESQYVRKPQENIVYLVSSNLSAVFEKEQWRDKTIVSIPKENIVKIVVKSRDGEVTFEKSSAQMENILGSFTHLQALSFASKDVLAGVDLENDPSVTQVLLIGVSGNILDSVNLYFYEKDETVYAKREGLNQIFTVSQTTIDPLKNLEGI